MGARLRLVEKPAPNNDNTPAWAGYVYAPPAPPLGLVDRVFALRFSPALLARIRGSVIARSQRP